MNNETLLDSDGENRAVRSFLMAYSCDRALSIGDMANHMRRSGWSGHWPDWVSISEKSHLTKAGAQLWIRHLFDMEAMSAVIDPTASAKLLDTIIERLAEGTSADRDLNLMIELWRTKGRVHPGKAANYTGDFDEALRLFPRIKGRTIYIEKEDADGNVIQCGAIEHRHNVFHKLWKEWPPARQLCYIALKTLRDMKGTEN